jgi:hypothetical protein
MSDATESRRPSSARRVASAICAALLGLWLLVTIVMVAQAALPVARGDVGRMRVLGAESDEGTMKELPGLAYEGMGGVALAGLEIVAVALAFVVALRAPLALRRIGLGLLLAWCGLWAIGSIWMEQLSQGRHPMNTTAAVIGGVIAAIFVVLRWPR